MLMPRKVAHRKHHRGRTHGMTKGGSQPALRRVRHPGARAGVARPPDEAAVYADDALNQRRQGLDQRLPGQAGHRESRRTRMGSGKGNPEFWVAVVRPGRVLFELSYPNEELARSALNKAIQKLPIKARVISHDEAI